MLSNRSSSIGSITLNTDTAYLLGKIAYLDGKTLKDCPYYSRRQMVLKARWEQGFKFKTVSVKTEVPNQPL